MKLGKERDRVVSVLSLTDSDLSALNVTSSGFFEGQTTRVVIDRSPPLHPFPGYISVVCSGSNSVLLSDNLVFIPSCSQELEIKVSCLYYLPKPHIL